MSEIEIQVQEEEVVVNWWLVRTEKMGDANPSRYVKLTKDQESSPTEDIKPGELNQPIEVPQVLLNYATSSAALV